MKYKSFNQESMEKDIARDRNTFGIVTAIVLIAGFSYLAYVKDKKEYQDYKYRSITNSIDMRLK